MTTPVRADRLGFMVDAAAYFHAFVEAVREARESVLVIAWDVDSQLRLLRGDDRVEHPVELAAFLEHVLDRRPGLDVHVLCWDFSVIYTLEREAFQRVRLGWTSHDRLHFEFDDEHPPGGAHHQKIVVVDDRVAFLGGIDLGRRRWDTPEHRSADDRRRTPDDDDYPPFHDVQAVVSGPAAGALGEIARERWRRATGEELRRPSPDDDDPWPGSVGPAVRDLDVRLVRTEPAHGGHEAIRDTEEWLLDAIGRAEEHIWIENQYLTAEVIADALDRRLREQPGLTVAAVTARQNAGWLEQATMGTLRARFLERLARHRDDGRFAVYWPSVGDGSPVNVHSKLIIVDDAVAYLGSANLSNRSMGLDTECGVAIDADGREDVVRALRELRVRLVAEHLDVAAEELATAVDEHGDPVRAIEALRGSGRTLVPLEPDRTAAGEVLEPVAELVDPDSVPSFEELIRDLVE